MKERINLEREREREDNVKRGKRKTIAALAMTNDSGVARMTASNVRERERERVDLGKGRFDLYDHYYKPNWPVKIEPNHKYWQIKIMHKSINKI